MIIQQYCPYCRKITEWNKKKEVFDPFRCILKMAFRMSYSQLECRICHHSIPEDIFQESLSPQQQKRKELPLLQAESQYKKDRLLICQKELMEVIMEEPGEGKKVKEVKRWRTKKNGIYLQINKLEKELKAIEEKIKILIEEINKD